jgi:glutathione peroxidase
LPYYVIGQPALIFQKAPGANMSGHFYQFSAKTIQGKDIRLDTYTGKIILIVNTASKCGFTPQYAGLEKLYQKYKDRGFVILGFPCNQFGSQEPDDEKSIVEGCLLNYGVSFPMFSKVEVNGENAHPLFKYLAGELPGVLGGAIKWNFTKFLINRDGTPVKRFAPNTTPEEIDKSLADIMK